MNRDYEAAEVTVGSVWYVWGEHQKVVERYEAHTNEAGAPSKVTMVRLNPLNSDGTLKKVKTTFPIQAWRVLHYGEPSVAYTARQIVEWEAGS